MAGDIVHLELKSADFERTSQFYSRLFGWKMQHMPEMSYLMWQAAAGPGGGFVRPEMSQAPGTLAYIAVDDIAKKLGEIDAAGGRTVLGKMAVGEMGFMAIFVDPEGNTVGLWQSTRPAMPAGKPVAASGAKPAGKAAAAMKKPVAAKKPATAKKPGKTRR